MALPPRRAHAGYFLLRRWTRVFFSSLRCFFFAIRLRRFLMTEPTRAPRHDLDLFRTARLPRGASAGVPVRSGGLHVGTRQVVVHRLFRNTEGPSDTYRGERPPVDQPIDR